eukprot:2153368-Rhodomonas_salina.1
MTWILANDTRRSVPLRLAGYASQPVPGSLSRYSTAYAAVRTSTAQASSRLRRRAYGSRTSSLGCSYSTGSEAPIGPLAYA